MGDILRAYWANAIFSAADRDYNAHCATQLRQQGFEVFLPQEAGVNEVAHADGPSAENVFLSDTAALLKADLLIACIDQECIDAGVATEVGIAYTAGIPVVGLYTDFRQFRTGPGRMYKNLYVIGCLEASLGIVSRLADLIAVMKRVEGAVARRAATFPPALADGYTVPRAVDYAAFVGALESWYEPSWSLAVALTPHLAALRPRRLLDFGCGVGRLAVGLRSTEHSMSYVGYDSSSEMVSLATRETQPGRYSFTSEWSIVEGEVAREPFDLAVVAFLLHDQQDPGAVLSRVARCVHPDGHVIIVDLTTWDLPHLTRLLRSELASPTSVPDRRLSAEGVSLHLEQAGLVPTDVSLAIPRVSFPSAEAVVDYLRLFGILDGSDLPIEGVPHGRMERLERVRRALSRESYPFVDQRAFLTACAEVTGHGDR